VADFRKFRRVGSGSGGIMSQGMEQFPRARKPDTIVRFIPFASVN
jgi:hypothetical protein